MSQKKPLNFSEKLVNSTKLQFFIRLLLQNKFSIKNNLVFVTKLKVFYFFQELKLKNEINFQIKIYLKKNLEIHFT